MYKKQALIKNPKLDSAIDVHMSYYQDHSYPRLVDQLIEEMSELTKVLLKERRKREVEDHIKEEVADVVICIEHLLRFKNWTIDSLNPAITEKSIRMIKALAKGKE